MNNVPSWNQISLRLALDEVRDALRARIGIQGDDAGARTAGPARTDRADAEASFGDPEVVPALERLCACFQLTPFEHGLLLLCAGHAMDAEFATLCGQISGDPDRHTPTFDLALTLFNGGHWMPFHAHSTLRYWELIELDDPKLPNLSPLRINAPVLAYLTDYPCHDPNLDALLIPAPDSGALVPSHDACAQEIRALLFNDREETAPPIVQLTGPEDDAKLAVCGHAVRPLGLSMSCIDTRVLPREIQSLQTLYRRLERQAILVPCGYVIQADVHESERVAAERALHYLLQRLSCPCLVTGDLPLHVPGRQVVKVEVKRPTYEEQRTMWSAALARDRLQPISDLDLHHVLDQFDLNETQIRTVCRNWRATAQAHDGIAEPGVTPFEGLWRQCRTQSRTPVSGLARVLEPSPIEWDVLILPDREKRTLRAIVEQVRHRGRVYRDWGFARQGSIGLGISALFAGASGTGKTLAARIIGRALQLDVYHVDLSAIVSKYIGETEKNLEAIFRTAEASGAILLFDEADALFGKRTKVQEGKDRWANMEVSYLLQRMEAYTGLSILTTNLQSGMDEAFTRRLRFIVQFPFPQAQQRASIWEGVFPEQTPTGVLDYAKLARPEISGGVIRCIALNAAFHAARDGGVVEMRHLARATREEFAKTDKTLLPHLVDDWVEARNEVMQAEELMS
jgi:hypothetical protein